MGKKAGDKKKGGGGGGGGKKKGGKKGAFVSTFEMPDMGEIYSIIASRQTVEFVDLSLRFASLAHLDFEWRACPTLVSIGAIKDSIRSRHNGGVSTILLYLRRVHESCLINGPGVPDSTTLRDIGVKGSGPSGVDGDGGLPKLVLYYNYPADEFADPLLMAGFTEVHPRFLMMRDDCRGDDDRGDGGDDGTRKRNSKLASSSPYSSSKHVVTGLGGKKKVQVVMTGGGRSGGGEEAGTGTGALGGGPQWSVNNDNNNNPTPGATTPGRLSSHSAAVGVGIGAGAVPKSPAGLMRSTGVGTPEGASGGGAGHGQGESRVEKTASIRSLKFADEE